jgi:hypothetical protein
VLPHPQVKTLLQGMAALLLLAVAACGSNDQNPGIQNSNSGPTTTSHLLASCPPGGPDATTPAAGCLDPNGNVVHPSSASGSTTTSTHTGY